jgi:hypothetical protein
MAAVTLAPTADGGTELVLTHRGVPKDLIPETERAWRGQYCRGSRRTLPKQAEETMRSSSSASSLDDVPPHCDRLVE